MMRALITGSLLLFGCSNEYETLESKPNQNAELPSISSTTEILPNAAEDEATVEFVRMFIGMCMQVLPEISRIADAAATFGWKEIDPEVAAVVAPIEKDVQWKSWMMQPDSGPPLIMFASEGGEFRGDKMVSCGAVSPRVSADHVADRLISILKLDKPSADETEMGQRYRMWLVRPFGESEIYVSLVDASPMNEQGVNLSAMTKEVNN